MSAGATRPDRWKWPRRLGWLALIWSASVLALGIFAMAFRAIMSSVGLTP